MNVERAVSHGCERDLSRQGRNRILVCSDVVGRTLRTGYTAFVGERRRVGWAGVNGGTAREKGVGEHRAAVVLEGAEQGVNAVEVPREIVGQRAAIGIADEVIS